MKKIVRNQEGFTLIEIIAVLILLGILAAVAIPKYMDLTDTARGKAASGQIAEVKGRLNSAMAKYMLANSGSKPAGGSELISYANSTSANSCPTSATTEGDFEFVCAENGSVATRTTITVSKVQGVTLSPSVSGGYDFSI